MNDLAIFNNPEFGEIRTLDIDNEPWFVGKDVAASLRYADPQKAVKMHVDDDDKLTRQIVVSGQNRNVTIINESGLYSLILSSKLPSAKSFKHWVTSEVIPSIRKTGGYTAKPVSPIQKMNAEARLMNAKARQAKIMLDFARLDLCTASKELLAANAMQLMTGRQVLSLPETVKTYSAGEVGEMLGISANKVGRIANLNHLKTDEYGITVLDTAPNGKQIPTFRYNDKAVNAFRKLLNN